MKLLTFTKQTSRRLIIREVPCREPGEFAPDFPTEAWATQVFCVWLGYTLQPRQEELPI